MSDLREYDYGDDRAEDVGNIKVGPDRNNAVYDNADLSVLHIPLSSQGSTAQKVPVYGDVVSGEIDLTETVGNEWNNGNWLTFPGTPSNPFIIENVADFTRLDNLSGGFLVATHFYFGSNPTGQEVLLSFQPDDTTNGGWRIDQKSSGNIEFRMRPPGGSLTSYGEMTLGASWQDERVDIISYIDTQRSIWYGYARVSGVIDRQLMIDLSGITLPVNGVQSNIGVGGLAVLAGTINAGERLGEDGNGARLGNIVMARFDSDFSKYLPQYLSQAWKINGNELPAILRSVS